MATELDNSSILQNNSAVTFTGQLYKNFERIWSVYFIFWTFFVFSLISLNFNMYFVVAAGDVVTVIFFLRSYLTHRLCDCF